MRRARNSAAISRSCSSGSSSSAIGHSPAPSGEAAACVQLSLCIAARRQRALARRGGSRSGRPTRRQSSSDWGHCARVQVGARHAIHEDAPDATIWTRHHPERDRGVHRAGRLIVRVGRVGIPEGDARAAPVQRLCPLARADDPLAGLEPQVARAPPAGMSGLGASLFAGGAIRPMPRAGSCSAKIGSIWPA